MPSGTLHILNNRRASPRLRGSGTQKSGVWWQALWPTLLWDLNTSQVSFSLTKGHSSLCLFPTYLARFPDISSSLQVLQAGLKPAWVCGLGGRGLCPQAGENQVLPSQSHSLAWAICRALLLPFQKEAGSQGLGSSPSSVTTHSTRPPGASRGLQFDTDNRMIVRVVVGFGEWAMYRSSAAGAGPIAWS